jgi:hypothetical protein
VAGGYPNAAGSSTSHAAAGWIPPSGVYACPADAIHAATTISAIPGAVFSLSSARTTAYGVATVAACGIATTAAATREAEEEEEEEECHCCGVGVRGLQLQPPLWCSQRRVWCSPCRCLRACRI